VKTEAVVPHFMSQSWVQPAPLPTTVGISKLLFVAWFRFSGHVMR
jgi:hypothetical protein